jgi:lipopolysaccharide export system permease protein
LYWAFLIGGEKLSERGFFSPFWGMWTANILLGIAGVFLVIRSVKETVTLNFSFIKKFIPQQWQSQEEQ